MDQLTMVRLAAEKVMRWRKVTAADGFPTDFSETVWSEVASYSEEFIIVWNYDESWRCWRARSWNPFTSDTQCWMLVHKLVPNHSTIEIRHLGPNDGRWQVYFPHAVRHTTVDQDLRRAIVIGCLKAVGAMRGAYLASLGGQIYLPNQPANVMITVAAPGSRFELTEVKLVNGSEYDQTRFVNREVAESLVAKYPDMWRIE